MNNKAKNRFFGINNQPKNFNGEAKNYLFPPDEKPAEEGGLFGGCEKVSGAAILGGGSSAAPLKPLKNTLKSPKTPHSAALFVKQCLAALKALSPQNCSDLSEIQPYWDDIVHGNCGDTSFCDNGNFDDDAQGAFENAKWR